MAEMTLDERQRRLKQIRDEHYPLMVSQIVDWLQLHRDPDVIERALHEAALMEKARLEFLRERGEPA